MRLGGSVLLCLALAACAGQPATPSDDPDAAASKLDVKATANTGVIRGVVVDATVRPLANVYVTIEDEDIQRITSKDGAFGFESLPAGDYQVLAQKDGFHPARQSVRVRAGIDDPPITRFQLAAVPSVEPRFEALQFTLVTGLQYCIPVGCYSQPGPWEAITGREQTAFAAGVGQGAVAAQAEVTWQPQTSMAEHGMLACHSRSAAHTVGQSTGISKSPAVQRVPLRATMDEKDVLAVSTGCRWSLDDGALPVAVAHQQDLEAILHVFYNFQPDAAWRFGLHGDPGGL